MKRETSPTSAEKPYGYVVTYERRKPPMMTEEASFRRKGSEAAARREAIYKVGYIRVVKVDPYTREQWIRCFGEGRM